ncbi:HAMP domain-containing sensor histidine kinase [Pedobacter gandavensis]|uniref:PorY family sensor histidine kinase n=1 Tax=Pedobacter gandavensis TaxID=2679963 RepID=UPI00292CAD92|nr:HAMP domain-containing sensor histidine kinase [Pedobacter gandavensis]
MRLLSKISLYHFWLSLFVLSITGFFLFTFLQREISREIEEQLELQTDLVASEIQAGKTVSFPLVQIKTADAEELMKLPKIFKDTLIYDRIQQEQEGYYYFEESKKINGKAFRIRVMTTYIGWGNYSRTITYIFITIAIMFIALGTLLNYFISRSLWKPFLNNLNQMKKYSVSANTNLELSPSNVKEFQEMNEVLTDLSQRGRREYLALKEFTENASHEIQTPLSILKTRLESISQLPVSPELTRLLGDAKQSVTRLSRVNRGLLLLAKLENNTFAADQRQLSLTSVLQRNLELMADLFMHKKITVESSLEEKQVFASPSLMEILVSNLLSNALSHSAAGARVIVVLTQDELLVSNDGPALSFEHSRLFTRFGKGSPGYTGNGLGLSILKQICIGQHWQISYTYHTEQHHFKIKFTT